MLIMSPELAEFGAVFASCELAAAQFELLSVAA